MTTDKMLEVSQEPVSKLGKRKTSDHEELSASHQPSDSNPSTNSKRRRTEFSNINADLVNLEEFNEGPLTKPYHDPESARKIHSRANRRATREHARQRAAPGPHTRPLSPSSNPTKLSATGLAKDQPTPPKTTALLTTSYETGEAIATPRDQQAEQTDEHVGEENKPSKKLDMARNTLEKKTAPKPTMSKADPRRKVIYVDVPKPKWGLAIIAAAKRGNKQQARPSPEEKPSTLHAPMPTSNGSNKSETTARNTDKENRMPFTQNQIKNNTNQGKKNIAPYSANAEVTRLSSNGRKRKADEAMLTKADDDSQKEKRKKIKMAAPPMVKQRRLRQLQGVEEKKLPTPLPKKPEPTPKKKSAPQPTTRTKILANKYVVSESTSLLAHIAAINSSDNFGPVRTPSHGSQNTSAKDSSSVPTPLTKEAGLEPAQQTLKTGMAESNGDGAPQHNDRPQGPSVQHDAHSQSIHHRNNSVQFR